MLVIKEWDPNSGLEEVDLSLAAFWMQVHNLSIGFMIVENVPIISRQLGRVLNFENAICNGVLIQSFLHIRMLVSLVIPLKLGFWLDKPNRERCYIKFKYERL